MPDRTPLPDTVRAALHAAVFGFDGELCPTHGRPLVWSDDPPRIDSHLYCPTCGPGRVPGDA